MSGLAANSAIAAFPTRYIFAVSRPKFDFAKQIVNSIANIFAINWGKLATAR
jgi:hypothetical protein